MGGSGEWGFPGVGRGHGRGCRSALGRVGAAGLAVRSPEGPGAQSAGAPREREEGSPGSFGEGHWEWGLWGGGWSSYVGRKGRGREAETHPETRRGKGE